MSNFYVLYDEKLGFVAKGSGEVPQWTFRLEKAVSFIDSKQAKRYVKDMGYIGYMLNCTHIKSEIIIQLANTDKRNKKFLRG